MVVRAVSLAGVRFGYVPYADDLSNPGDRRRFVYWARDRGVNWEPYRPAGRYDVVMLAGTADLSAWRDARTGGPKVVYELIDSYLDAPASLKSRLRGIAKYAAGELRRPIADYRAAIERTCTAADAVVCSTPEQRTQLLALNPNVHEILDAHVDLVQRPKADFSIGDVANVVWEGLPYTLDDMEVAAPALRRIARRQPLALHVVTDLEYQRYTRRFVRARTADVVHRLLPRAYLYEWNEQLLAPLVVACDLAVIPLDLSDPFARAKPENKLLLFWRMGMPTLTSATPAYVRTMAAAGQDLTCETTEDWELGVEALLEDEDRRRDAGTGGRCFVETNHSSDRTLERWDELFESVLN